MSPTHPSTQAPSEPNEQDVARQLLRVLEELSHELHPGRRVNARLDSSLERDLGLDSLARVELAMRMERRLQLRLSEEALARAETPRDLLKAGSVATDALREPDVAPIAQMEPTGTPEHARTLPEALAWHAEAHPERMHARLYGEGDHVEELSYGALQHGAERMAAGLQAWGLEPGQKVALMLPTGRAYLECFLGTQIAGGVPVPIYPPTRPSQLEDHLRRHAGILSTAEAVLLLTVPEARAAGRLLRSQARSLQAVTTPEAIRDDDAPIARPRLRDEDVAFMQFTSGSTGQPKGVVLDHANLLANIRAMCEGGEVNDSDIFVSWLPLYHDMGLIGAWLTPLYFGVPLALMSPLSFLSRPQRWLWTVHRDGGTVSAAPNFAYELCVGKLRDEDLEGLDLSSWRMALNGAEPVSAQTVRRFCDRFEPYGFRRSAMAPVYGLAEGTVGLTFPPQGREPLIERVDREAMTRDGRAEPAGEDDPGALEIVGCGQPLPGHQIRVVDAAGKELPDRREGQLQFSGPSATRGYYRNGEATQKLFDDGWLNTGDLAYIDRGELFLTGRVKDLIIKGGRNLYPQELEEAVGGVEGVRKGGVAVFASTDPKSGTERVVVLAETRLDDDEAKQRLQSQIHQALTDVAGVPPDDIVLAPPRSVLKTSSGKIRRAANRELYERGDIGKTGRAPWWQAVRVAAAGVQPELRRARRAAADAVYAGYAWSIFGAIAPPGWLALAGLRDPERRWRALDVAGRLLARLSAVPVHVQGREHLERAYPCVLVANHASYLDPLLLVMALSRPASFVAKRELRDNWLARVALDRLGTHYVERFEHARSVEGQQELVKLAQQGQPLFFFPEGTFTRVAGLRPFHMGGFLVAAAAGRPVVPIALRGTRSVLRDGSWMPRRHEIHVVIGEPLHPDGQGWRAALKLRDHAREWILEHCGEPDLEQG